MRIPKMQRGFLLIVAVVLIAVGAAMAAVIVTLTAGSGRAGGEHVQSTQALFAAESGIEHAIRLYQSGTACANIPAAIGTTAVGAASYSVSIPAAQSALAANLAAPGVSATATTIPTTTANLAAAGFGAHGRIVVDGEQIIYTGLSGNSFTGARRGYAGTTAALHAVNAPVIQNQCLVRATGVSGSATRIVESAIQNGPWSSFLDDTVTAVPTAFGVLHTANAGAGLVTAAPAGDNIVVAMVALNSTAGRFAINAGNLLLVRGVIPVTGNLYAIDVGGGATPSATVFPQKSHFLVFRDAGVAANQTYRIFGRATGAGVNAEVKMLVIHSPPNSSSQATANQSNISTNAALPTTILTHNSNVPAGDNIVFAAVQWDNQSNAAGGRNIGAGNLRLNRGGILVSNEYQIDMSRNARVNANGGMLLIARDANAPANPVYTVTAAANGNNVRVEAKLVVVSGVASARLDGVSTALTATPTMLGALATAFPRLTPGASNLIVAATQYDNAAAAARTVAANDEDIVFNAAAQSSNEFQIAICDNSIIECDDFASGLMWRQTVDTNAVANPGFSVQATPSATTAPQLAGEAKVLGIYLNPVATWREIFP